MPTRRIDDGEPASAALRTVHPMSSDYALQLSDQEAARYLFMAEMAASDEAADWAAAGIVPGAAVADVGCGPGAMLAVIADAIGPSGTAVGVDGDEGALVLARQAIADRPQARVQVGRAEATGLDPGSFDVVVCRHVLAHNGGREEAIVAHLAELAKPGGAVYLVDVHLSGSSLHPVPPGMDIDEHYRAFHAHRGNDLLVGLRLGSLLEDAGLDVERYHCVGRVQRLPVGIRGPQWAARDAMVAEGVATAEDVARWHAAFVEMDRAPSRPWMFIPMFVAVGRRPG